MRWKKDAKETGLRTVFAGPRGSKYWDGELVYARVYYLMNRGWYFVAGWDSDVPYKNTCHDTLFKTEKEAKECAVVYIKYNKKESKDLKEIL
jgi:hypothetical protein